MPDRSSDRTTLDDFLTMADLRDETAALAAEGAREGRRIFGAADLDGFARAAGAVEVGVAPVVPRIVNAGADRAPFVDDHVLTVDEIIAQQDARHGDDDDQVPGSKYADLEECAAGTKRVHGRSGGGDKGPRARRTGGAANPPISGPTKVAHEHWDGDHRSGKVRPVVVGARVTVESKDALDADQSASNGEVMEEVALIMQATGKTKREVLDQLQRWRETGMVDPEIADAVPSAPSAESAA